MKRYTVSRTWLVHESGTKFHQSFQIAQTGSGPGVTIFHFGKLQGTGAFKRPISGGQVQIKPAGRYYSQIKKKREEGYHSASEGREREVSFESNSDFVSYLRVEFGATKATEILSQMSIATGHDAEVHPEDAREDTPIDKFAGRPAAWGSW